ncbi:efflux RND transporter periplasmic adaptor subunit [Seleniivibrio woodruffii]|uniref:HlyD family secretion protein n=1 Tax=Seleniivibrio woodruffii TaxID=1078050 RepID=A0A4R1K5F6_9BACT|nr:efflux RND transporter periplasmic adaptor subunit [Seleniivibrio woodruffii]TCK59416.1 HlyD family secretion protein [Seleniivibrio woodruffii]TVZ35543.1 HlyD family secretion protein [Seleniivibrio woodruffii]
MSKVNTAEIAGKIGGKRSGGGRKKFIWLGVIAVIVIALGIKTCVSGKNDIPQYKTVKAEQGDFTVKISATGTLQPTNQVEVGSELSGTVKAVYADYNSKVTKGQILAELDTEKLESQLTQYAAAVKAAQATVLQSQATERETLAKLNRLKNLYDITQGKSPSKSDMDAAQADYDRAVANTASAQAQSAQAEANLKSAKTDLSKAKILSPVNGVVLTRSVEPGQTVAASYQAPVLFTLAEDLKEMELIVNVDEADIGQVKEGMRAEFTVDAYPDKVFKGDITQARYGSETVDNVVTYATVIRVDNSNMLLRPGMTATSDIIVKEQKNAVIIPNEAFRYAPPAMDASGGSFVSKLMPRPLRAAKTAPRQKKEGAQTVYKLVNGMPQPVEVATGESNGNGRELIQGDIKAGDELVIGTVNAKGK